MSNLFHDEGAPANGRKKIMLATPSYGPTAPSYTYSIARSREALSAAGLNSSYLLLQGLCHVDDARNAICRHFLASDCTDLLFLDSDVDWEPEGLVQLAKRELDIVGGVYPYRRDGGEQMPVRLMERSTHAIEELLEVDGLPTGFMKIKRAVLELMIGTVPRYFDKLDPTHMFFSRPVPGEDMARWGGDIDFCNRAKGLGFRIFADSEIRLGHAATIILRDSLGSHLRRVMGQTMKWVADRIRRGEETDADYNEAFKYVGNNYAADPGVLATLVSIARKCRGDIIETGSGLSSVLMGAAAPDCRIYSLEHIQHYAAQTVTWCEEAAVNNVGMCYRELKDFWYDYESFKDLLPARFALGFCDGPPRLYGTRTRFLTEIAPHCEVVVFDDATSDMKYLNTLQAWADANGRKLQILGRTALITKPHQWISESAA
jgi:predicted O-methyltransferase YrrM